MDKLVTVGDELTDSIEPVVAVLTVFEETRKKADAEKAMIKIITTMTKTVFDIPELTIRIRLSFIPNIWPEV